jgi:succinylglutamate desuccinylase
MKTGTFWIYTLLNLKSIITSTSTGTGTSSSSSDMLSSTTGKILKVVVVGGTHGNEYTGVWCIKALDRQLKVNKQYPSLFLSTVLGNPQAYLANKRFVDQDLNRQFSYEALVENNNNPLSTSVSVESKRAHELNQLLGPKKFEEDDYKSSDPASSSASAADVIIDLHTTTTTMGTTLIVGEGDPLMTQAAAYVMKKCGAQDNVCVLMHTHKNQKERPHLSSIAPHSFSVEVGSVPQGVLRHDMVEKTQRALGAVLEFLERHNKDDDDVLQELKESYPTGRVPCYRSAPAQRPGEMSGKIKWPSDPDNENFPAWVVHKDVQDQDFCEIKTGDPLFVDLDGKVINYNGSHGSPVLLMFVNEGGYYYASSGTGISVARRDEYSLETGQLLLPVEDKKRNSDEL